MERVFGYRFGSIYDLYVAKVERKGRTVDELRTVLTWLTGLDEAALDAQRASENSLRDFFDAAPMTAQTDLITGVVCGVRVEDIEDPLMQKIRYMDKVVDELARGKAVEKVIRG